MSSNNVSDEEELFHFEGDDLPKKSLSIMTPQADCILKYEINDQILIPNQDQTKLDIDDHIVKIKDFVSAQVSQETSKTGHQKAYLEDFEILSVIGKGAYGQVFLVKKHLEKKLYAMKVLKKAAIVVHGKETEHTKNERSILEEISHPFIVKLYYAFQCPTKLYLILKYASGGELFSYLSNERMFSDDIARFYVSELLLGLEHLHSLGIIYRDLKPENVMLDEKGHVMLTDFGLSKVAVDAITVCGTIEFMAPEILNGRNKYDKTVDFWSLGIMLFDMLTGSPPFSGPNRKKIMENILNKKPSFPRYIIATTKDLLIKLLKKDPKVRLGNKEGHDIKNHNYFRNMNWKKLLDKKIDPPFVPEFKDSNDTSHFDVAFTSIPISESLLNDRGLMTNNGDAFVGFSYVAESFDND